MAKVEIVESLYKEISKKFRRESIKIFQNLKKLEDTPKKGKFLGNVGDIAIKEIKHKGFRFYFLIEGHNLKFLSEEELIEMLIRFVRMSDKKHQQETINEIKNILKNIGPEGFK